MRTLYVSIAFATSRPDVAAHASLSPNTVRLACRTIQPFGDGVVVAQRFEVLHVEIDGRVRAPERNRHADRRHEHGVEQRGEGTAVDEPVGLLHGAADR